MGRAPCCDKNKVKSGPWSPQEDATLKDYLAKHGGSGGSWITLPYKAGLKRCGKSCRLRWLNYLRPDIKHGGFTEEEDNIICTLYNKFGSRWSRIASQLPGRTDNEVKNYWNTRLKKKVLAENNNSNSSEPNLSQSPFSIHEVEAFDPENSSCFAADSPALPPLMERGHNYQEYSDPQGLILDQNHDQIFPHYTCIVSSSSGSNYYNTMSMSQEVSGLSTSSSRLGLENINHSSWSGNEYVAQGDENGILLDDQLGFESSNYKLLSGFGFPRKGGEVAPCSGSLNPPFTGN